MNQYIRICIYFVLILALTYAFVKFIPISFHPSEWHLKTTEEVAIVDIDSSINFVLHTKVDSSALKPKEVEKDTVITNQHLSCPTQFIKQLSILHKHLCTTSELNKNIRILHFGDSQIEGDRITAHLREAFQNRYGGSGPGLTTIYDPQKINPSVWLDSSGDWQIHSVFNKKRQLPNKAYGLMGQTASLKANSVGTFKISPSPWAEQHASHYQKVRLFIAPHTDTLHINAKIKSTEVIHDALIPSEALTEINWEFEQLSPTLKFSLSSNADVHILGCALDSVNGVTVDNIALRGQSSLLLHRTDGELFKAMGEHLNIGMIIFQFGTNVIPTIAPNYHFYKVHLAKQFDLLKTYLPDVPVIIIGVADAAHQNDGILESYDHLQRIRDTQKEIALDYDFAFFDLYKAMGGKGSIIEWSQQDPPLALKDYIHLSRKGGQEVASLLTNALWHHMNDTVQRATNSTLTHK